jgi:6-phosphogluconolactonase/glucosamine-6-phosphate isomerase/deaminase
MDIRVSEQAVDLVATLIARRLADAIRRRGEASLALSGGNAGPPLVAALAGRPVDWRRVGVWQVDERIAPDGDPARNAGMLAGLDARLHLMPVTSADLERAAHRYAARLPERFDAIHLGLGDDGHTASWAPGDDAVLTSKRSVEIVPEFNGLRRMTLTPLAVNAARARYVLALGVVKRPMVERWLLGDATLPISKVRQAGTLAVLDFEAAPDIGFAVPV